MQTLKNDIVYWQLRIWKVYENTYKLDNVQKNMSIY